MAAPGRNSYTRQFLAHQPQNNRKASVSSATSSLLPSDLASPARRTSYTRRFLESPALTAARAAFDADTSASSPSSSAASTTSASEGGASAGQSPSQTSRRDRNVGGSSFAWSHAETVQRVEARSHERGSFRRRFLEYR